MDERKIKLHVLLLSFLLISVVPSILGLKMRGTTRSELRKLMVTNLEVDYSGDYDDGASSALPSPPVPVYDDDIYKRQGDVPSPGIGH
ncbi:hypothetical protein N665_0170s0055 [Sinapis alba]|nr:hypothetical protein N665_0170s0055 [Sinapis alba]